MSIVTRRVKIEVRVDADRVRFFFADFGGLLGYGRLDCHQRYQNKREAFDHTDFSSHVATFLSEGSLRPELPSDTQSYSLTLLFR